MHGGPYMFAEHAAPRLSMTRVPARRGFLAKARVSVGTDSSGSWPVVAAEDPLRGKRPAPERPGQAAMPEFAGQGGWWDGEDGAPGVGQAVAAHLGKGQPPQRTPASGAHDQHIIGAAGQVDQHPARRPALNTRLYPRIAGNLTPDCHQRVPEPLAGQVPARLSQYARRHGPVGAVTARHFPGDDRDQDRIKRGGT